MLLYLSTWYVCVSVLLPQQATAGQPLASAPVKPPPEDLVPVGLLRQKEQELKKLQGDLERSTKQVTRAGS
jgi:hypothetical protein